MQQDSPQQVNNNIKMESEPHFFVNDFLVESEKLKDVIKVIDSKPEKYLERAEFLKKFTNEMFDAYRKLKYTYYQEEKTHIKEEIEEAEKETEILDKYLEDKEKTKRQLKQELLKKKEELIKKMQGIVTTTTSPDNIQPLIKPAEKPLQSSTQPKTEEIKPSIQPIQKPAETKLTAIPIPKPRINNKSSQIETTEVKPAETKKQEETTNKDELTKLIEDKAIHEIICEGPNKSLKVISDNKEKIIPTTLNQEQINDFIKKIAAETEQPVSEENPFLLVEHNNLEIQGTLGTSNSEAKFIIIKK